MVKTTRILTIMLLVALASCATSSNSPDRRGGVTEAEARDITLVVRAHTSEPILGFTRHNDTIDVETGWKVPPDAGSGHEYTLRKSQGKWKVVKVLAWMA
jgi:hypothetical protein